MAANTIRVSLLADAQKFKSGMREADQAASGFGKSLDTGKQKMGDFAKFAVAGLAAGAGAAVIGFFVDATKAALEDAKAQDLLKLAIQNTTGATDSQVEATEEFVKQTALASGVADDQLRPALAELVRTSGSLEEAQDLLGTAMDIAAAKGKPLEAVTTAIGKAALGNVGALGRLGVATKDAEGNTLSFEEAMAEAERTMGDASETAADTEAGSLARLTVAFDEAKESVGFLILDGLKPLMDELIVVADQMNKPYEINADPEGALPELAQDIADIAHWYEDPHLKGIADFFGITLPDGVDTSAAALEDARTHGLEPTTDAMGNLTDATEDQTDAEGDLEGAIRDTISARQAGFDQMQAQLDPFFAFTSAIDDQAEAQVAVNEAQEEFGKGSPEHINALRELAEKGLAVEEAEIRMAAAGGITREEFEKQRVKMGLTAAEAQILIDKYDIIFTERNVTHTIRFEEFYLRRNLGDQVGNRLPGAQHGGMIHGPTIVGEAGPEVFVPGSTGTVIPNHALGAGVTNIFHIHALGARDVVQALQEWNRKNGGVPITVRNP